MVDAASIEGFAWQEPVRGGYLPEALFARPGIDQLRSFERDQAPYPPIHHLTGMRPTDAGEGWSVFEMPATDWLVGSDGLLDRSVLAVLADGPLGSAFQSVLPAMQPYTTTEITVSHLARPQLGGELVCHGRLVGRNDRTGLTEARITDGEGTLVAFATSRCLLLDPPGPAPQRPPPVPRVERARHDTPDPYEREALGEPVPAEVWAKEDGRTILAALARGERALPPLARLTGLVPVSVEEGALTAELPASAWFDSPFPRMQGGVLAMLAEAALAGAVRTTLPAGGTLEASDVRTTFMRPVTAGDRRIRAAARVVHRGRSFAVATSEVHDGDRRVALASATCTLA